MEDPKEDSSLTQIFYRERMSPLIDGSEEVAISFSLTAGEARVWEWGWCGCGLWILGVGLCGVWGEVWAWVVEFDVVNFVTMLPS